MPKPVARLALDSRSYGPAYCKGCNEEVEDVVLMDDGSLVCPECKETVEGFEEFSDSFVSAVPYRGK